MPPVENKEVAKRLRKAPKLSVYGNVLWWGRCHVGIYNVCVRPPCCRFGSGFACIRIILGKTIFFVSDLHHFGKQERNETTHFWALKPKKTLFLLLFALKIFVSLHLKIVLLRNETKDKKLQTKQNDFRFDFSCYASEPINGRRLPKQDPTPDPDLQQSKKSWIWIRIKVICGSGTQCESIRFI